MLSERAANRVEDSAVACLRVALYMTQGQFDRAVEVCLEYLRRVGVEWSPHPTKDDVDLEYAKIWRQLGARAIEQLVDLLRLMTQFAEQRWMCLRYLRRQPGTPMKICTTLPSPTWQISVWGTATATDRAHVSRVTTMGELAASIAHEVNQPLSGIVTNANASLRWLAGDSPNLAEAREAIRRIIRDGNRASDVVSRMRALLKKARSATERLDINEAIKEIVILTQSEAGKNKMALRTELAADLPPVMGDRVQLQQVV